MREIRVSPTQTHAGAARDDGAEPAGHRLRHLRPLHRPGGGDRPLPRSAAAAAASGSSGAATSRSCRTSPPSTAAGAPPIPGSPPVRFPHLRRPLCARPGANVTQMHYARKGIVTPEMEFIAIRENQRRELARETMDGRAWGGGVAQHPGQSLGRGHPGGDHPRVRARRGGARARDHPGQHQPSGERADDHRPQLPGQDQRQHRQLGGDLLDRGGGGEAGLGDPLGRRHGDGPVDGQEHPRDPRVDPAQLAGADRHGADLPGAGEGGRQGRGAHLGDLPRHPDRAGRAGGRLLHHPRRRAARLRAADREPDDRHRLARRLDPRQVVPGAPPGELPLHALRGDLRDHARLRRHLQPRRRPAPGLDRRRQRRGPVRRARDPGRADRRSPGATTCR